jgi:hypothetical protein
MSTYQNVRFGLMVGVGAGVPKGNPDIQLGDTVVSEQRFSSILKIIARLKTPSSLSYMYQLPSSQHIDGEHRRGTDVRS